MDGFAIDIRDDSDLRADLRERGLDFNQITNGDDIATQHGVKGTPIQLLVDATGTVA